MRRLAPENLLFDERRCAWEKHTYRNRFGNKLWNKFISNNTGQKPDTYTCYICSKSTPLYRILFPYCHYKYCLLQKWKGICEAPTHPKFYFYRDNSLYVCLEVYALRVNTNGSIWIKCGIQATFFEITAFLFIISFVSAMNWKKINFTRLAVFVYLIVFLVYIFLKITTSTTLIDWYFPLKLNVLTLK